MLIWLKNGFLSIKSKPVKWTVAAVTGIGIMAVIFTVLMLMAVFVLGPPSLTTQQNTIYYSQDKKVIGEEHGPERRYWVELDEISPFLVDATIYTEDRGFYQHHGFDLKRIASAIIKDIQAMAKVEGASTITQQYSRNLYLSHEKTWTRKLKEAFYTLRLEMFYSKDQILEGYLNTIYYGHGAYGIEAASRHFLEKPAAELNLAEAAMLAGIPKGPSYYSPFHNMENAQQRQQQILQILVENNKITKQEKLLAEKEVLALTEPEEQHEKKVAPYFLDAVLAELQGLLDEDRETIRSGGYQVYTTLDADKQKSLEKWIKKEMVSGTELQIGALAMDPKSGAVLSMVGGTDYKNSQFNRTLQAKRMPGSSFKPFLYYAALESGYTATTALMSKPTAFELADGTVYQPSNYNSYYANKPISLAQAIALSDNVYAVKTNLYLGTEKLVETAKRFGIKGELKAVPSLALGTGTVTVEDMTSGYSMLANGGFPVDAFTITKVTDSKGKVLYERKPANDKEPVLDPKKAFILTHLLTGMFDESLNGYMHVTGSAVADQLTRPYAGKSGTTATDSWMVGYSPDIVTGIWVGYDQNKPMEIVQEQKYAKEIWAGFMEEAHQGIPFKTFPVPDGIVGAYIDPVSGDLATPYCNNQRLMYFEADTAPTSYCKLHYYTEPEQSKQNDTQTEKQGWKRWFDWLSFDWLR